MNSLPTPETENADWTMEKERVFVCIEHARTLERQRNILNLACQKALKDARMFGGMGSDTMTELEDAIKLAKGGER